MLNIVIADDHPIFRSGLRAAMMNVWQQADIREAGSLSALRKQLVQRPADLITLDIFFPGLEPEEDIKSLRTDYPLMAILVVSMLTERGAVERLIRAGANGFVSKSAPPESMTLGLEEVMAGERPIHLPQTGRGRPTSSADNPVDALPPRQKETLRLICLGMSNKEIARELGLSVSTIRAHVSALFQKLDVTNRTAAATYGINHGVLASSNKGDHG